MRYAGILKNDIAAAPGICVTFFAQGCPHHCPGCHNPETWSFSEGRRFTPNTINEILEALVANGVNRNFCIMGGEPLCPENELMTQLLITEVRKALPQIKIYVWTGYKIEELIREDNSFVKDILYNIDFLIDGPYIEELKDTTLPMRGSSNQRIINIKEFDFSKKI